jgi:hypothetical protein
LKLRKAIGSTAALLLLLGLGAPGSVAQDPAPNPETENPALPRVLLIGDSISMGYTVPVRHLLQTTANVYRIPENGGPTTNGVAKLEAWLGDKPWDVVHFNFGLHDLKIMDDGSHQVEPRQYEENLRTIVTRLRRTGAKLIWATTTPVPEGVTGVKRNKNDPPIYNAIARGVMQAAEVPSDDLYSFALPRLMEIQLPANVHYTPDGYQALAQQVAESIQTSLNLKVR